MTLVIAAITEHFAVLATDRRIQWSKTVDGVRTIVSEDDSDTKTFIMDRRYIMGFAGLGRFFQPGESVETTRGRRLEAWMMEELGEVEGTSQFAVLADRFGTAYEKTGYRGPHTFLAVGFRGEDKTPCVVTIANSQRFIHSFDVATEELDGAPFLLRSVGEQVDPAIIARLETNLSAVTRLNAPQPLPLHDRLVWAIRQVARSSEARVGDVVTVTSLPRCAIPADTAASAWMDGPPIPIAFQTMEVSWTYSLDGAADQELPARISEEICIGGVSMGTHGPLGPLEGMGSDSPSN